MILLSKASMTGASRYFTDGDIRASKERLKLSLCSRDEGKKGKDGQHPGDAQDAQADETALRGEDGGDEK